MQIADEQDDIKDYLIALVGQVFPSDSQWPPSFLPFFESLVQVSELAAAAPHEASSKVGHQDLWPNG